MVSFLFLLRSEPEDEVFVDELTQPHDFGAQQINFVSQIFDAAFVAIDQRLEPFSKRIDLVGILSPISDATFLREHHAFL
jgi:hypothetical protein